jgi:hypothetical protein
LENLFPYWLVKKVCETLHIMNMQWSKFSNSFGVWQHDRK